MKHFRFLIPIILVVVMLMMFTIPVFGAAPTITTRSASYVTQTSAVLQGSVDNLNGETDVFAYFEYGKTTAYGTRTTEIHLTSATSFSATIISLTPNTVYHYRAVVRYNTTDIVNGLDVSLGGTGGIGNPDAIDLGYYKVFYNVVETGDMLFVAESRVVYDLTPTDYNASESFTFDVLDVGGVDSLLTVPLQAFGYRPISVYQTASSVTAKGLLVGSAYVYRIVGNPLIFPSTAGNITTQILGASDFINQSLGVDGGVPTANPLRNGMVAVAKHMQAKDNVETYMISVDGTNYLTTSGGALFLEGIPSLNIMCPILFQSGTDIINGDTPESKGTYATSLSIGRWGAVTANGLKAMGSYLGISQALAGSLMLFVLAIMLAVFIYQKTESGIAVLLIVATTPFIGAFLGLMPMALAFIFVILIIMLMGYYFFSRGAL
jgi:hypothetical protein